MDAAGLCDAVERRYRQYLQTMFHFRDPALRASFHQALAGSRLSRGPYVEGTPAFEKGCTLASLASQALGFQADAAFLDAIHGRRPLHWHQEAAVRRVLAGDNVVVTTGTGSGKTEAFLHPILLHLYREFLDGRLNAGVRALILYPMNALVNDQRERFGDVAGRLAAAGSPFRFTFGQYVGATPEDQRDARRHAQDRIRQRLPGELVLRSEMRETPPHVLLTNYSMLEYLLLRPDDSPLFDNGRARAWTFLVLDEAHQYRGAKGIEMAMLLRRLKDRLRAGGREQSFRCIATSATIAGGEAERPAVARFAAGLFGEPFSPDSVIFGKLVAPRNEVTATLDAPDYALLEDLLDAKADPQALRAMLIRCGEDAGVAQGTEETLGRILARDARTFRLRSALAGGPQPAARLADTVFAEAPEAQRPALLHRLIRLLLQARDPEAGSPLLNARYHFFLRSLEGAFLSFVPEPTLLLDRGGADGSAPCFELALCRECGQHYLVGSFREGKLAEAVRDPGDEAFGAVFLRPLDQADSRATDDGDAGEAQLYCLCTACGAIRTWRGNGDDPGCGHGATLILERQPPSREHEDQVSRCGACGYQARDPVQELVHGTDGPHAVVATTLAGELPPAHRKVLAFADSRQDAAFFAWYLDHSYREVLSRNLLLRSLRTVAAGGARGASLRELAWALHETLEQARVLPPSTGELELRREAWRWLYREFLTRERRISLEGVGLLRWQPDEAVLRDLLARLPRGDWPLTDTELRDLLVLLLQRMREEGAVDLRAEGGVSLRWSDLDLLGSQAAVRLGTGDSRNGVRSWDRPHGHRAQLVRKVLSSRGVSPQGCAALVQTVLGAIWETLISASEAPGGHGVLLRCADARRLNPDWWRAMPIAEGDLVVVCETCGRIDSVSATGLCARAGCPGRCAQMPRDDLEDNHYRRLYQEDLPGRLRVEEHTAQIDRDQAQEFQRAFKEGHIHVLSCSTTFELGVDLGDLDTVFLRNVPPEAFNYAQRVGRAGRRAERPGLAITYCRRSAHDLYHFAAPEHIIAGQAHAPVLSVRNAKILRRHATASILSDFLRAHPERFGSVTSFCHDVEAPDALPDVVGHVAANRERLDDLLRRIVPGDAWGELGLSDGSWPEQVAGEQSRLKEALAELASDASNVSRIERAAAERRDYDKARWANGRLKALGSEDVLSFLSRKAVIPKYGFPVDVVELETSTGRAQRSDDSGVALQRDLALAIAEFAPSSRVVANKKEWVSAALKRVAEREWPWKRYWRCSVHNRVGTVERGSPLSGRCCDDAVEGEYIIPRFGFLVGSQPPQEPHRRPARLFVTRPYFLQWAEAPATTLRSPALDLTKASPGTLVVLCEGRRGQGFHICETCGSGIDRPGRKAAQQHQNPFGEPCDGPLRRVALGHEFVTDAVWMSFRLPHEGGGPGSAVGPDALAYALAFALVEGMSSVVDVPSSDLGATVAGGGEAALPPIVLYDAVPGGAGLVACLEDPRVLRRCLEAGLERVSGACGCGESESCYGCLRSYRNQFVHRDLRRGPTKRYLERALAAL